MGPRPADFDEQVIRQSPTFVKWARLGVGEKLRYACREFVKGHGDDEERLMRRIMIARRNNLRDHETLKRARHRHQQRENSQEQGSKSLESDQSAAAATSGLQHSRAGAQFDPASTPVNVACGTVGTGLEGHVNRTSNPRKRRSAVLVNDDQVQHEMDVQAVEATRSYRTWMALASGSVFVYNQKYIKGQEGHDWLLRKNIWRRMRYRRENKKMVERMKQQSSAYNAPPAFQSSRIPGTTTILDGNGTDSADLGNSSSMVKDSATSPPDNTAMMAKPRPTEVSMASHIVDQSLLATSRTHHINVPADNNLHSVSVKQDPDRSAPLLSSPPPGFSETTSATAAEAIDATAVMAAVAAASSATTHDLETAAAGMFYCQYPMLILACSFGFGRKWLMRTFNLTLSFCLSISIVEAACAVAESYAKNTQNGASGTANSAHTAVRNSLGAAASAANPAALDAAARLAAATASTDEAIV